MTADHYQPYRDMLAGREVAIHADKPYPGRYRTKSGQSVLINFTSDGHLRASVDGKLKDPAEVWTYCAKHPVTREAFDAYNATGKWPGEVAEIGHNSGDLSLAEQIKDYAAQALGWLREHGIKDATSKDMAANYRLKLLEFRKTADAEREANKRPHLEASRAVDVEFKPLIEAADAAANEIRDALTAFMREEERKEREAKEKAWREEQARIAAERERIEKERAEKMARDPIAAMTDPEPELPMAPAAPEPVKVQAGGQGGRKTGLRTITKYIVTDYAAALAHVQNHPDVRAAVEKVAAAQAKAGASVPGVEKKEERVAA